MAEGLVFVCGCCRKELHLRHDCDNNVFYFAAREDFDEFDNGNNGVSEALNMAEGACVIKCPKIHAEGEVWLKRR